MKPRLIVRGVLVVATCTTLTLLLGSTATARDDKAVPRPAAKTPEKRYAFQMDKKPWGAVFEWLSKETGLPVVGSPMPAGTFTFVSPPARTYTLPEIFDVINEGLLASKFILIRRPRLFTVAVADERLDWKLAPMIHLDELLLRGNTEVVRAILSPGAVDPKEAAPVVKKMLSPFGEVLPIGNKLLVLDTAGNLRQIVRLFAEIAASAEDGLSYTHKCAHVPVTQALRILKELMGSDSSPTKAGNRITLTIDPATSTIHVRGPADRIAEAKQILARIDVAGNAERPMMCLSPTLKVYSVSSGDAEALAKTLQELFRASTCIRITAVGSRLLVYATLEDQLTIAKHLQEILPTMATVVLPLTSLDPAKTAEVLRTMFSRRSGGPTFEADTTRNALIVRCTKEQVEEIRMALKALGDSGTSGGLRSITLERGDAATLAEAIQEALLKLRANPIRVIVPGGKGEPETKTPAPDKKLPGASKAPGKPAATLTIFASGNRLLVSCDDPEALALVQQLVNLYTAPQEGGLEVIRLQNAKAASVAPILDEVFNGRPATGVTARRVERVRVVADPVGNSLIVRATPLDLLTIRRLLTKSLDVPAGQDEVISKTYILSLRHAIAADVAKILREVFKVCDRTTISVGVDMRTNSVILRCSAAVFEDVKKLVEEIDQQAKKKE